MKTYKINAIYKTVQGEATHAGYSCALLRFSGCNLWSGLEVHRASAICKFCDTDFYESRSMSSSEILESLGSLEPFRFVLLTGGEPAIHVDSFLLPLLKERYRVHIETNGTIKLVESFDWVTVSPKAGTSLACVGDELKLVYPQNLELSDFVGYKRKYLQPMWGVPGSLDRCLEVIYKDPSWGLSLQTHKYVDLA